MPLTGQKYSFTKDNVDAAPAKPGVYGLYDGVETIYYGSAVVSIRSRLQRHKNGDEGNCTKNATHFRYEECSNPREREKELIDGFKRDNNGKLPRCNEVSP